MGSTNGNFEASDARRTGALLGVQPCFDGRCSLSLQGMEIHHCNEKRGTI